MGRRRSVRRAYVRAAVALGRGIGCGSRDERREQVERQREDDRRVLVGADLQQGLQVAQLQRRRLAADDRGRAGELLGGLVLAFGVDDLGAALALGLCLVDVSGSTRRNR
jgi:hypothetical protein